MKAIFELYYKNKQIFTFDYLSLEENPDSWRWYCYNARASKNISINENEEVTIFGNVKNGGIGEWDFKILKKVHIENTDCLVIDCEIDTSDLFFDFDQQYLDLIYFFDNEEYVKLRKQQKVYNFVCARYSGYPEKLPSDKNITIDCSKIYSDYFFYTTLAELLIGEKAWIGNGTDSFEHILETSGVIENNNNIVNLLYFNENVKFDVEVVKVLENYGFTVNYI